LNLVVRDLIDNNEEISRLLKKCRAIVGHFKRSALDFGRLQAEQEITNTPKHKFIQEVVS